MQSQYRLNVTSIVRHYDIAVDMTSQPRIQRPLRMAGSQLAIKIGGLTDWLDQRDILQSIDSPITITGANYAIVPLREIWF